MPPTKTAGLAGAVALLAAIVALPGLAMPFLSDDWAQLASSREGERMRTPVGDFRPAAMATIALDDRLWGGDPRGFHLTNLVLIAASAGLVVVVARRLTGDAAIAGLGGVLFALHPWHVENAAWIAARGDPLYAVLLLLGAICWLRWRERERGIPWAALVLFEAALLAKESAVAAIAVLATATLADGARRRSAGFWLRGVAPFVGAAVAHALARTIVLGGPGRIVLSGSITSWPKHLAGMVLAAIVPFDAARFVASPAICGAIAVGALVALLLVSRRGSGRVPATFVHGFAICALLAAPHAVGFQERYVFLPVAASSVAIASLVCACGRARLVVAATLVTGFVVGTGMQWRDWREAARASERFTTELVRVARASDGERIVLANAPFRVRGGSVAGHFEEAIAIRGGPRTSVRAAAWLSSGEGMPRMLASPPRPSRGGNAVELVLGMGDGLFDRLVAPHLTADGDSAPGGAGSTVSRSGREIVVTIPCGGEIVVWNDGRLDSASGPCRSPRGVAVAPAGPLGGSGPADPTGWYEQAPAQGHGAMFGRGRPALSAPRSLSTPPTIPVTR